jgi:heme A synthase
MIFILTEGAVGALLVLLEQVGQNDSLSRAYWMAGHLLNTFLLLGALTATAWWAATLRADDTKRPISLRDTRLALLLGAGLLLIMAVSALGAVTALGDTLYPPASVSEGVARDFAEDAHFSEALRIWHPVLAVFSAIYLYIVLATTMRDRQRPAARRWARIAQLLVATQIAAGFVNMILLAPLWMQVVHLFLADSVWIALLLVGANALAAPAAEEASMPRSLQTAAGS